MLNMDFTRRVVIRTNEQDWQPSPAAGVERIPLAREEAERGHATSLVRYAPGSSFSSHNHPLGEEILVLEGVFSDENGHYPAGTYLRNPPGSCHAPFSNDGCTLLVKLHQFDPGDNAIVRLNTNDAFWQPGPGNLQIMPLHDYKQEHVTLVKWRSDQKPRPLQQDGDQEIFVLRGELQDEHGRYPAGTWLRTLHQSSYQPCTSQETMIWLKTGHLQATPSR